VLSIVVLWTAHCDAIVQMVFVRKALNSGTFIFGHVVTLLGVAVTGQDGTEFSVGVTPSIVEFVL